MSDLLLHALGAAVVAALLTNLTMPPVIRLAVALRALDHPNSRKLQVGAVPRLGGVAILVGLLLGTGVALVGHWGHWGQWDRLTLSAGRNEMLALAVGTALVFLVGLVDDLVGVSAAKKFVFQAIAAWLLIQAGWSFEVLRLPFVGEIDLGLFGGVVSVLWIVGVTNAINLIDGLDGLAGGVVAIIALSMLGYAVLQGNSGTVILMAATAGACLGFLRHNWEPARIFMGDSGSLTLGYLLAAVSVHSALKAPAAVAILVPILALGVPVMDTVLVMAVRFLDRPKGAITERFLRMFHADRQHLHHLLAHVGGKRSRIVAIIYSVVLSFCGLALVVAVTGQDTLGVMLVALEFSVILFMRQLGLSMEARRIARQQKDEMKVDLGLAQPQKPEKVSNVRRMAS
ncbi:MAG TPA: MraY family glycosyltransferase [Thermoanaerobaculia bacterium]|nr:MraY family glycosyltransferase [Thermoanaerobaculia bacterium]